VQTESNLEAKCANKCANGMCKRNCANTGRIGKSTQDCSSSLLFKAKVLNVYVLPIYKLKVLHPPETYFQEGHKMICDFLWEGKRHWVKPLFVYLYLLKMVVYWNQ